MKRISMHEVTKIGLALLAILLLSSCDKNSAYTSKAVREFHLSQGKIKYINENHIMVLELEHHNANPIQGDLSDIGTDCYPFKPIEELSNIQIDISSDAAIGYMSIQDLSAQNTITFFPEDNNVSYTFHADKSYEICFSNSGQIEKTQTLFVRFYANANKSLKSDEFVGFDQGDINALKAGKDCTGLTCDLTKADLSYMDLSDLNLSGAKMNSANLYGANLSRTILDGTHMNDVAIQYAVFNHTNINTENFTFKGIEGASFEYATFYKNTTFYSGDNYTDINFNHADLSNTTMSGVHFHGSSTFVGTKFYNTQLYGSEFHKLDMRHADFEGARVDKHASFYEADIRDISEDSLKVLENSGANLKKSIVYSKGDGTDNVRYEEFGDIRLYYAHNCRGDYDTLDSNKNYHINCKKSTECENDKITSLLFYPRARKNIAIRLYDDPRGRIEIPLTGTEDYTTVYRNRQKIKEPFCIDGLEHDTYRREEKQGFSVNYHAATGLCSSGLNGHVSHIRLVDEDDM